MSSEGSYMTSVVITALTVITFFILILAFLYMIWGRKETPEKET